MTIHFGKEKWLKVAQWVLLVGCWLLIVNMLGGSAKYASHQVFLELGPEKIVGTQNVIYQEAPDYLYTNPMAMFRLHFHCLAVRFGVTLLVAALATGLVWAYKLLFKRKVWTTTLKVVFWCAMGLALLYLGMVCVWEWGQAWNWLLLYAIFYPRWSPKSFFRQIKSVFTAMAMITALVILGWQRMELQSAKRRYDAFWDSMKKCVTQESFVKSFGEPATICRNIPEEEKEWFDSLANFDASLWHPGKTLAAFISPQMPNILLLPWFDDDGNRIALAWCDFTPERKELLDKKREVTRDGGP
ncbi:MAG: hypothetical protein IJJ33_10560 [Victivallales bacterium]|nr:hypothetical protein [Victivallales bacterium]